MPLQTPSIKMLWVSFGAAHSRVIFGICCRPPGAAEAVTSLQSCLCSLSSGFSKAQIILLGDFNHLGINWYTLIGPTAKEKCFVDMCLDLISNN